MDWVLYLFSGLFSLFIPWNILPKMLSCKSVFHEYKVVKKNPPPFPEQPYVFTSLHIAVVFPLPRMSRMLFSVWVTVAQNNYHPSLLLAAECLLLPLYWTCFVFTLLSLHSWVEYVALSCISLCPFIYIYIPRPNIGAKKCPAFSRSAQPRAVWPQEHYLTLSASVFLSKNKAK